MRTRTRAVEAAPESGRPSSIGGSRNTPEGPRDRPRRARGSEDLGTRPRASSEPGGAQASRRERASAFPATVHGADTRPEPWPRAPPRVREQVTVEPDRGAASGGFPSGRIVRKSPVLDFLRRGRGRHRGLQRLARRGVARTARSSARLAQGGLGRQVEDARSDRLGEGKNRGFFGSRSSGSRSCRQQRIFDPRPA